MMFDGVREGIYRDESTLFHVILHLVEHIIIVMGENRRVGVGMDRQMNTIAFQSIGSVYIMGFDRERCIRFRFRDVSVI